MKMIREKFRLCSDSTRVSASFKQIPRKGFLLYEVVAAGGRTGGGELAL